MIWMLFCCRVRCNPHQSAAIENKTKKKKKKLPSLHFAFQLCLLKHRNVANDTIDPSGTLNGWDKRWLRSSVSDVRADTALPPGSDRVKTVHETSAKGRVCGEQTRLLKIKRHPMWMALYLTNEKCSFSHDAGGGDSQGI